MECQTLIALFIIIISVIEVHNSQSTSYESSSCFCCNSQLAAHVKVLPADLEEIVSESPTYVQVVTGSFYTDELDNVCHTYYPLGNGTYLRFTGTTYPNGTYVIQKLIVAPVSGYPGVIRVQGLVFESGSSSFIYDEIYLGSACPGVRVYYRYHVAGSCTILSKETEGQTDFRHGDSSTRDISDCCKCQVSVVGHSQKFTGSNFVAYPNRLNRHCVTKFNGVSCINPYKVLSQDSVILSDIGSSCLV